MSIVLFFFGVTVGGIGGAIACVRYTRQGLVHAIGPALLKMQTQVDIIQSSLLSLITIEHSELGATRGRELGPHRHGET